MWPVCWTTILVQTCNHMTTAFVDSGQPYIPLEEGSHCALLPVGLRYMLLALNSISVLCTVFVNIEVCLG